MKSALKIITKKKQVDKLITYIKQTGYCSFDFETNARPFHDPLFIPTILGISFQPGSGYILPLAHKDSKFKRKGIWLYLLKKIGKEIISNPNIIKVAWNASFEIKILKLYGIEVKGRLFDGIMAKYLLKEERPNGLKDQVDSLIPFYANYDLKGKPSSKAKKQTLIDFWTNVEINELSKYCALDCDLTLRLMMFYEKLLLKHDFYKLFRNMLMMGTRVLSDSEYHGMPVDQSFLEELVVIYKDKVIKLEQELYKHPVIAKFEKGLIKDRIKKHIFKIETEIEDLEAELKDMHANYKELVMGRDNEAARRVMTKINSKTKAVKTREEKIDRLIAHDFRTKGEQKILEKVNFASPKQMIELFHKSPYGFKYKVVKYTTDPKTKKETKNPSTDEEVLLELQTKDKTGFITNLLDFRGTSKLYSTYIVGMYDILSVESRIHASYLLYGTVTGRLSSREPNFQNIPRDTTNADIKKMFIPPKGKILLQLDYSQAELRVMAAQANETEMLRWFREGRDIHLAVACDKMKWDYDWALPIYLKEDKTDPNYTLIKVERKYAKTINFGIIYGQTANKLSIGMGTSIKEAEIYLKEYNKRFPNIAKFIKKQNAYAERHGYVRNIFGRKRRLPNIWHSEWGKKAEAQRQCVDELTQALTKEGWKNYNELKVGDLILTKNPETGKLEWQPIQNLNIYDDFKGDLYHIKNKSFDALVTEEHKWLANVGTKRDTNSFYTTKELFENKLRLIHRQGEYTPPEISGYGNDLISFIGWILTDGSLKYYNIPGKPRNKKPHSVRLTQSYKTNPDKVVIIEALLKRLDLSFRRRDIKGSYNWVFDITVAEMLHKIIPKKELNMGFLLSLTKEQLELLYESMSLGDGHRSNNAIITGKSDQADMIQILNIMLGRYSNINERDNIGRKCYSDKIGNKKGYVEIKNKSYSVTKGRNKFFHTKSTKGENHITKLENQEQLVWCPTVENQSWVARRNGKQYITGNSVNAPIQGAASDFTLFSSILIWEKIRKGELPKDMVQCYTVHDSLGFFLNPADVHWVVPILDEICSNPETLEWFGFQIDSVRMQVDFEVSHISWAKLSTYHKETNYSKTTKEFNRKEYNKQAA